MKCPNCEFDLKENEQRQGSYTQQIEHFGRPFRVFGYLCGNCGFHITMIQIPVNTQFKRTERTYDKLDSLVSDFQKDVVKLQQNNKANQITLFDFNDEEIDLEEPED